MMQTSNRFRLSVIALSVLGALGSGQAMAQGTYDVAVSAQANYYISGNNDGEATGEGVIINSTADASGVPYPGNNSISVLDTGITLQTTGETISLNGSTTINGATAINSTLGVAGALDAQGSIRNTTANNSGNVTIDDGLYVTGAITATSVQSVSTVTITGNSDTSNHPSEGVVIQSTGAGTGGNVSVLGSGVSVSGGLTNTGNMTNTGNIGTATLSTTGDVSVGGNLDMTGGSISGVTTLTSTTINNSGTTTTGALSVTNNATVGGTFGVTGATTLSSTLDAQGSISNSTGSVTIADDLNVTGATTTIGGTSTTINSSYTTVNSADTSINATNDVKITANTDNGSNGDIYLSKVNGSQLVVGTSGTTITGTLGVSGTTTTNGITNISGGISNTGGIDNNGSGITEAGAVSGVTTLSASGLATLSGGATVTGATAINTTGNATTSIGNVDSATTVGGTLGVTGATTLSSSLNVSGTTTLGSTLDAQGSISNSIGNVTIADALDVTGATSITGTLSSTGNTTLGTATGTSNSLGNAASTTNTIGSLGNGSTTGSSNTMQGATNLINGYTSSALQSGTNSVTVAAGTGTTVTGNLTANGSTNVIGVAPVAGVGGSSNTIQGATNSITGTTNSITGTTNNITGTTNINTTSTAATTIGATTNTAATVIKSGTYNGANADSVYSTISSNQGVSSITATNFNGTTSAGTDYGLNVYATGQTVGVASSKTGENYRMRAGDSVSQAVVTNALGAGTVNNIIQGNTLIDGNVYINGSLTYSSNTSATTTVSGTGLTGNTSAGMSVVNAGEKGGVDVDANGKLTANATPTQTTSALTVTNTTTGQTHGFVVNETQATISGGTRSTSLTLNDNGAFFSNSATGKPVRVTGVQDGTSSFDAVNFRQLREVYAGVAGTAAMANIPQVDQNKTFSVGVGLGNFQGMNALAIGASYRMAPNAVLRASVSSVNGDGNNVVAGVGAGFSW